MTETMNVHKALTEIKSLDSKIMNLFGDIVMVVTNKNSNDKIHGVSIEDYEKYMVGGFDKVNAFIARKNAIKKAVDSSNANTTVKIGDNEYTVTEAISLKNHGMEYYKCLLDTMKSQYAKAIKEITKVDSTINEKADQFIVQMFGDKEKQVGNENVAKMREQWINQNKVVLVDPLDIKKKIDELEEMINNFMSEVDAALSTSNAITMIEVEW